VEDYILTFSSKAHAEKIADIAKIVDIAKLTPVDLEILSKNLGSSPVDRIKYPLNWLYDQQKHIQKKITNLKCKNKRNCEVLFTGFTLIKNTGNYRSESKNNR
jgi:hypothetical protein